MKFFIKYLFSKCDQNPTETADLVTFPEEILNGNIIFCAVFVLNAPFLYPLNVFWYFQGVERGGVGKKWVKQLNFPKILAPVIVKFPYRHIFVHMEYVLLYI